MLSNLNIYTLILIIVIVCIVYSIINNYILIHQFNALLNNVDTQQQDLKQEQASRLPQPQASRLPQPQASQQVQQLAQQQTLQQIQTGHVQQDLQQQDPQQQVQQQQVHCQRPAQLQQQQQQQQLQQDNSTNANKLVLYYTEWCGYSQQFLPIWKDLKDNIDSSLDVALIEYDCDKNNGICMAEKIEGYPTLILHTQTNKIHYTGARTVNAIMIFLKQNC